MKILVYGAGVLGSYLTHVLHRGGNDVTVLARGKREQEIKQSGLIIRHSLQLKTTVDKVKVTGSLLPEDFYDIIFVVMQYSQIENILPLLAGNIKSKHIVFIGNNPTADDTLAYIRSNSPVQKQVLFGFQSSGGRRESGKIISIHARNLSKLTLGSLDGHNGSYSVIEKAFMNTTYQLEFRNDMLDWLKSHVAFIMPLAYLTYQCNGNLKKAFNNQKLLAQVVDAIDEGYKVLEACGYKPLPIEQVESVRNKRKTTRLLLNFIVITPLGRLAISDHAVSAFEEMKKLSDAFDELRHKCSVATPNWIDLESYMMKSIK